MRFFVALLGFFAFTIPAFAFPGASYSIATTNVYTQIVDFDALSPVKYRSMQILSANALPLECAGTSTAAAPFLRMPTGFTSLTLDDARPTGRLFCRYTGAGSGTIVVNLWGAP
jgi:hypothetical protein